MLQLNTTYRGFSIFMKINRFHEQQRQ